MASELFDSNLSVSPRVSEALGAGHPVVALETTLVTHGFPPSEGLELALELEEIAHSLGAVPATIGVLGSRLTIGLSPQQLEQLAGTPDVEKLNLSNLAAGIASNQAGSTTVAATMLAAQRAGIRVFATGGIGGVHREASETGDVSADLSALARFPVAVVCAGAKAILDLKLTLEALETLGVPVYGFETDQFPAFYRRSSGLPLDKGFAEIDELAAAIRTHFGLEIGTGVVVANPISAEYQMPEEIYDRALSQALDEAGEHAIRGRRVTPFLLERLRELTKGKSTFSNKALLQSNVRLAAQLAVSLQPLVK